MTINENLWQDLTFLIDMQQDDLDKISNQIDKTKDYVYEARKNLNDAEKNQQISRSVIVTFTNINYNNNANYFQQ